MADSETTPTLRQRLRQRGTVVGGEWGVGLLSVLAWFPPLSRFLAPPVAWVIASVAAIVLVFMALMGRGDPLGRLFGGLLFGCMGFLALYLLVFEGLVVAPVLFGLYVWRAVGILRQGEQAAVDEMFHVIAALMAAGLPAMIGWAWVGDSVWLGALFTGGFYGASGWLYLYPMREWGSDYEPGDGV